MSDYLNKPPAKLPRGSEVIAYVRDSGGPAQEESTQQQTNVITAYCRAHGLILTRIYADTASGRKTKKRDQFLEMYHTVEATPEDLRPHGLLLWAFSRFSRDIVDFNFYLYGLFKHGLVVHSLTEAIPEGLAGQVLLSFTAYRSAGFSEELGKQIKRGIRERVQAGYCNGGHPPRGYRIVRDSDGTRRNGQQRSGVKWEVVPELAPLIRLAWELRAQGKGFAEITMATQGKIYTTKNSWTTHFRNKSYLGIGKAGDLEVPDHHEPIITHELWDAVQLVSKASPGKGNHRSGELLHHRRIKHPSLLSGLARCIYCGSAMVLHTEKDYRSYACGKRERQRGYKECTLARRVNARKADKVILDAVLNLILSPAFAEDLVKDVQSQLVDTTQLDRQIEEVYSLLDLNQRSIKRLMQLAEETDDIPDIAARLKVLKREQGESEARLKSLKLERDRETPQLTPQALAMVFSAWRDQIAALHQTGDILSAKRTIAKFVKQIDLGYNRAVIHYIHPVSIPAESAYLFSAHSFYRQVTRRLELVLE